MTSLSETSLRPAPPAVEDLDALGPTFSSWTSVEIPEPRRPSPAPLVVLGLLAGIAAMVVGAFAVVSAAGSADEPAPPAAAATPTAAATPRVERQVLALLAKPSTDRVVFHGSGGQLLLVVGSAGRAAILVRGFERAPAGRPYRAWVVGAGKPVRAGTFTGAERAVFLAVPVLRQERVVIARDRAAALRPSSKLVAARG
jgi:anti-sigma-K factor RskA